MYKRQELILALRLVLLDKSRIVFIACNAFLILFNGLGICLLYTSTALVVLKVIDRRRHFFCHTHEQHFLGKPLLDKMVC